MVLIWNRPGCSWINRWKVYWQVSEDVLKEGQRYYWGHQVKLQRAPVIETMNDKSSQQLTMPWVISFIQYFSHHCEWNYQTYIIKDIFWHEQSIDQINSACISINCIFDVIRKDYLIKRYRLRFNCTLLYANEIESDPMKVKELTNGKILFSSYKNGLDLDLAKILVNG